MTVLRRTEILVDSDLAPTPAYLAKRIIKLLRRLYDKPGALWLDPCAGCGKYADPFYRYMPADRREWCEIRRDRDFRDYDGPHVHFAATNPPWHMESLAPIRAKAFEVADNVALLLMPEAAIGLRRHTALARRAGFGRRTWIELPRYRIPGCRHRGTMTGGGITPVVVHWQRGYTGSMRQFDFSPPIAQGVVGR